MRALRGFFLLIMMLGMIPLWTLAGVASGLTLTLFAPEHFLALADEHNLATRATDSLVHEIQEQSGIEVPALARDQVVQSFRSPQIKPKVRTQLERALAQAGAYFLGNQDHLVAKAELTEIKRAFLDYNRGMPEEVFVELEQRIGELPDEVDLAASLGRGRKAIEQVIGPRRYMLWLWTAALGLLFVLSFLVGPFGSAARWIGLGGLLGGLLTAAGMFTFDWKYGEAIHRAFGDAYLGAAGLGEWMNALADSAVSMIRNVGFGLLAAGVGLFFLGGSAGSRKKAAEDGKEGKNAKDGKADDKKKKDAADKPAKADAPPRPARTIIAGLLGLAVACGNAGLTWSFVRSFELPELQAADQDLVAALGLSELLEQGDRLVGIVMDAGKPAAKAKLRAYPVIDMGSRIIGPAVEGEAYKSGRFSLKVPAGGVYLLEAGQTAADWAAGKGKRDARLVDLSLPGDGQKIELVLKPAAAPASEVVSADGQAGAAVPVEPAEPLELASYQAKQRRYEERLAALQAARGKLPPDQRSELLESALDQLLERQQGLSQLLIQARAPWLMASGGSVTADEVERIVDELVLGDQSSQRFASQAWKTEVLTRVRAETHKKVQALARETLGKAVPQVEKKIQASAERDCLEDLDNRFVQFQTAWLNELKGGVLERVQPFRQHLDAQLARKVAGAVFARVAGRQDARRFVDEFESLHASWASCRQQLETVLVGIRDAKQREEQSTGKKVSWKRAIELQEKGGFTPPPEPVAPPEPAPPEPAPPEPAPPEPAPP
ncbi:MAG: hypothetical protein JXR96_04450, partial [Deltaproteobacteria bacterium]|nr:hypothetical protein [Deltaproteobacteria bacterium]